MVYHACNSLVYENDSANVYKMKMYFNQSNGYKFNSRNYFFSVNDIESNFFWNNEN